MSVIKATKKPVTIEAICFEKEEDAKVIQAFCGAMFVSAYVDRRSNQPKIEINTLEGVVTASLGDYIIKGVKGEFYPCKPDIFEQTYDIVE